MTNNIKRGGSMQWPGPRPIDTGGAAGEAGGRAGDGRLGEASAETLSN